MASNPSESNEAPKGSLSQHSTKTETSETPKGSLSQNSTKTDAPDTQEPPLPLGRLIRFRALKPSELPAHPELASQQGSSKLPELKAFLEEALEEGARFTHDYLHKKFKVKHKDRGSQPSVAPVKVLERSIKDKELPKELQKSGGGGHVVETWFARESTHHNSVNHGTASWDEFDHGIRVDHSDHEMDYTPDVKSAHKLLTWDTQLAEFKRMVGEWHQIHMEIREMVHQLPGPLNKRVFSVLVITSKAHNHFIVLQIPVDLQSVDSRRHSFSKEDKMTDGMYVSIEHVQLVDHGRHIRWQMATCADTKGNLPMFAQKMGMSGAVVKDVGLFIKWTQDRRQGKDSQITPSTSNAESAETPSKSDASNSKQ